MGELLLEADLHNDPENRAKNLAKKAIRKEKKADLKVEMLINAEAWQDAIEEAFLNKKNLDLDQTL